MSIWNDLHRQFYNVVVLPLYFSHPYEENNQLAAFTFNILKLIYFIRMGYCRIFHI